MTERSNWKAIIAAFFVGVVGAVQVGRVAPVAIFLQQDFAFDLPALGWLISLITLASAIFGLMAGFWIVQRGLRVSLVLGAVVLCVSTLLSSLSYSFPMLLIARIAEGVGYLIIIVSAPTLIARDASAQDTPMALAIWGTFFTLGLSIAAIAGGWGSEFYGWRGWYVANFCLTLIAIVVAYTAIPNKGASVLDGQNQNASLLAMPKASWLLGVAFMGLTLLTLSILSMLPTFLIQSKGTAPSAAGSITGLIALASIAGSLVYGILANRTSDITLLVLASVVLIICAFPAFREDAPVSQIALFTTIAIFASGILVAQTFTAVPRVVEDDQKIGPSNGLVAQLGSIGALTGPPIVGYLVSTQGWGAVPFVIAGFTISFAVLFYLALRSGRVPG